MSRHTISTDGKWRKRGTYNRERERRNTDKAETGRQMEQKKDRERFEKKLTQRPASVHPQCARYHPYASERESMQCTRMQHH